MQNILAYFVPSRHQGHNVAWDLSERAILCPNLRHRDFATHPTNEKQRAQYTMTGQVPSERLPTTGNLPVEFRPIGSAKEAAR